MELLEWLNTPAFHLLGKPVPYSDLFGNICALATVVLALRRNILSWPVQILGSILLFAASISAGLGGNASRQVVIIVAAVWGWTQWKKSREAAGEVLVRWASWNERLLLL
ncbi:MAG: nicotinamide mononucleotide transporter family protein, partial [Brevibacterium sp.]|nr:nicotinamide mononucleotide transporter family protein [Brevibacterium sp.]